MSRISFEGIGEVAATFACGEGVKAGQVVKLTGDGTVGPCGETPTGGEYLVVRAESGGAVIRL